MSAPPAPPPGIAPHFTNGAAIPANPLAMVSDSILDANPMSHPVWDIKTSGFIPSSFDVACIDPTVFEDKAMILFQRFCLEKHIVQLVFPVAQEQFDKLHHKLQMLLILVVRSIHLRDGLASPRSDKGFDEARSGRATRSYDDALYSVFVGGLAIDTDISELVLVFNCFGDVIDAQLGDRKDCAFISFDSPAGVQAAISRMQGFAYFECNLRPAYGKPIRALARSNTLSEGRIYAMNAAINQGSATSILNLITGEFNGSLASFAIALRILARNDTQAQPAAPYDASTSSGSAFVPWYGGSAWNGTVYYNHQFHPSQMASHPPIGQWYGYNTYPQHQLEAAQPSVDEAQPIVSTTPSSSSTGVSSHHEVDPDFTEGSFDTPSSAKHHVNEPAGVKLPVTETVARWAANVAARQAGHPTRSQNDVSGTSTASRGPASWSTPVVPLSRTKSQEAEAPRGLDNALAEARTHGRLQSLPTNWMALDKKSIWAPI